MSFEFIFNKCNSMFVLIRFSLQGQVRKQRKKAVGMQCDTPGPFDGRNRRTVHVSKRAGVKFTSSCQAGPDSEIIVVPQPLLHIPAQ